MNEIDFFFRRKNEELRRLFEEEPSLSLFSHLPDSFLPFLYGEKRGLYLEEETRVVINDEGAPIWGHSYNYTYSKDLYSPECFQSFPIEGFWIPLSDGLFFSEQGEHHDSPLFRINAEGEKEILFLIHPYSKELFAPLIAKYGDKKETIWALSLSSFRTLLVAIKQKEGAPPQYALVKISLDQTIGNAWRILSLKECAGSVASTIILSQQNSECLFMRDNFSFVPSVDLLTEKNGRETKKGAGMIHREILPDLLSGRSRQYIIPLSTLLGVKNRELLSLLIQQTKLSPTQFVTHYLLEPLANILVDLVYFKQISIQPHEQNLLLKIDANDSNQLKISWIYRDMGGVNPLFFEKNLKCLPEQLKNRDYFYCENHIKDASDALESMVNKTLFNIDKHFFKSEEYEKIDPLFYSWKSDMVKKGGDLNWDDRSGTDRHVYLLNRFNFFQYGYFAKIFGVLYLKAMKNRLLLLLVQQYKRDFDPRDWLEELEDQDNRFLGIYWFKDLVCECYPAILQRLGSTVSEILKIQYYEIPHRPNFKKFSDFYSKKRV